MKIKLLASVLILQMVLPTLQSPSFAFGPPNEPDDETEDRVTSTPQPLTEDEVVESRACGKFQIHELPTHSAVNVCRTDNDLRDHKFKTKGADVQISVPQEILDAAKNNKEILDEVLLKQIREDADKIFTLSFTLMDHSSLYLKSQIDFINQTPDNLQTPEQKKEVEIHLRDIEAAKKMRAALPGIRKEILNDGAAPKHQIRKLLKLYPQIKDQLLKEHPEYRPLICRYELWKHRQHFLKSVVKIASIVSSVALLVGIPAVAYLWIPALPGALFAEGAIKTGTGLMRIRNAIAGHDDVRAARDAKMILKLNDSTLAFLKTLKQDPENASLIKYVVEHKLSEDEIARLKELKKEKKKFVWQVALGTWSALSGITTIYGGFWAAKKFGDFKATKPAHVTNTGNNTGGTNNQTNDPGNYYNNGTGSTGGTGGPGGPGGGDDGGRYMSP